MKIFEVYELWKYESKFSVFFNDTADAVEQIAAAEAENNKNKKTVRVKKNKYLVKL
jgi:hypothetical protein